MRVLILKLDKLDRGRCRRRIIPVFCVINLVISLLVVLNQMVVVVVGMENQEGAVIAFIVGRQVSVLVETNV